MYNSSRVPGAPAPAPLFVAHLLRILSRPPLALHAAPAQRRMPAPGRLDPDTHLERAAQAPLHNDACPHLALALCPVLQSTMPCTRTPVCRVNNVSHTHHAETIRDFAQARACSQGSSRMRVPVCGAAQRMCRQAAATMQGTIAQIAASDGGPLLLLLEFICQVENASGHIHAGVHLHIAAGICSHVPAHGTCPSSGAQTSATRQAAGATPCARAAAACTPRRAAQQRQQECRCAARRCAGRCQASSPLPRQRDLLGAAAQHPADHG